MCLKLGIRVQAQPVWNTLKIRLFELVVLLRFVVEDAFQAVLDLTTDVGQVPVPHRPLWYDDGPEQFHELEVTVPDDAGPDGTRAE
jgi:hypothetical protein